MSLKGTFWYYLLILLDLKHILHESSFKKTMLHKDYSYMWWEHYSGSGLYVISIMSIFQYFSIHSTLNVYHIIYWLICAISIPKMLSCLVSIQATTLRISNCSCSTTKLYIIFCCSLKLLIYNATTMKTLTWYTVLMLSRFPTNLLAVF